MRGWRKGARGKGDNPVGPRLEVDQRELDAETERFLTEILKAGTGAVHSATRRLEKDLEHLTRIALPGDRAWRAWASKVFPKGGGPAYEPAGEVYGKGGQRTQGLLSFWTTPGTVRAKRGTYLAVPLRAALGTYAGKRITPRQWEGINGTKLRPWFRPGKTPLLVADGYADGRGNFIRADRGKAKRRGGQNVGKRRTVPVFALIDEVKHANRVAVEPAVMRANDYLVESYDRRLARIGRG